MKQPKPEELERILLSLPESQQADPQIRAEIKFNLLCQLNSGAFTRDEASDAEGRFRDWLAEDPELDSEAAALQLVFKKTIWWPGLRGNQVLEVYLVKYRLSDGTVGVGVVGTDVHAFMKLKAFEIDPFRLLQLYAGWQAAKVARDRSDYVCTDTPEERAKITKKLEGRGLRDIVFGDCVTINSRNYYDGTCLNAEGKAMVWGGTTIYCGGDQADVPIASVPMSYVILGLELYGEDGLDNKTAQRWGCASQTMLLLSLGAGLPLAIRFFCT